MEHQWQVRMATGAVVLFVACSATWSEEGPAKEGRRGEAQELHRAIKEIGQQLKPLVEEALEADEALREFRQQAMNARGKAWQEEGKLRRTAVEMLAKERPDLAETLQLVRESWKRMGELRKQAHDAREAGENVDDVRTQLREAQKDAKSLWQTVDEPYRKFVEGNEELRSARQALEGGRKEAEGLWKDFHQKLEAKILEISPESKELLEERKKLHEKAAAMRMGMTPAEMQERRKKAKELHTRMRELEKKLRPVRQKLMAEDPEIKQLAAKLQQALHQKIQETAPELAEVIKERQELQEQMRQLWPRKAKQ